MQSGIQVTKEQVDYFKPGRRIPCCQMRATHPPVGDDQTPELTHRVQLKGARQPFNSLTISFIPTTIHGECSPDVKT